VSASPHADSSQAGVPDADAAAEPIGGDTEEIDALPVLVEGTGVVHAHRTGSELGASLGSPGAMIPAVQAAAVAAGGFVAGAAVAGLVHRRHRRSNALIKGLKAGRRLSRSGRRAAPTAGELVQIVGSRSLLVDVHLLGGRD
jgi:hypothetical protein